MLLLRHPVTTLTVTLLPLIVTPYTRYIILLPLTPNVRFSIEKGIFIGAETIFPCNKTSG